MSTAAIFTLRATEYDVPASVETNTRQMMPRIMLTQIDRNANPASEARMSAMFFGWNSSGFFSMKNDRTTIAMPMRSRNELTMSGKRPGPARSK